MALMPWGGFVIIMNTRRDLTDRARADKVVLCLAEVVVPHLHAQVLRHQVDPAPEEGSYLRRKDLSITQL